MGKKQVVLKILIWLIDDKSEIKKNSKKMCSKNGGGGHRKMEHFPSFLFFYLLPNTL